jgi:hypothetical protein
VAEAKWLLSSGDDVDRTGVYGQTALHGASAGGHFVLARLLIARGADLEAVDRWGATPLLIACRCEHCVEAGRLLDLTDTTIMCKAMLLVARRSKNEHKIQGMHNIGGRTKTETLML